MLQPFRVEKIRWAPRVGVARPTARPGTVLLSRLVAPRPGTAEVASRRVAPAKATRLVPAGAVALALFGSGVAHAQLGGLLKKAKGAIEKSSDAKPKFDDLLLELDDNRTEQMLLGLRAQMAATAPAAAARNRASAAWAKRDSLLDGRTQALEDYQESARRFETCRREAADSVSQARNEELSQRLKQLTPASPLITPLMRLATSIATRMQAGDSVGAHRTQDSAFALLGVPASDGAAKAVARCGKSPAKPDWIDQAERQAEIARAAEEEARKSDHGGGVVGASRAGLSVQQYSLALERITAFVAANGKPDAIWKFSSTESKVLSARLSDFNTLGIR